MYMSKEMDELQVHQQFLFKQIDDFMKKYNYRIADLLLEYETYISNKNSSKRRTRKSQNDLGVKTRSQTRKTLEKITDSIETVIEDLFTSVLESSVKKIENSIIIKDKPKKLRIFILSQKDKTGALKNAMCGVYAFFNICLNFSETRSLIKKENLEIIVDNFNNEYKTSEFVDHEIDDKSLRSGGWFGQLELTIIIDSLSQLEENRYTLYISHTTTVGQPQWESGDDYNNFENQNNWLSYSLINDADINKGAIVAKNGHYKAIIYKEGLFYLLDSLTPHVIQMPEEDLYKEYPFANSSIYIISATPK